MITPVLLERFPTSTQLALTARHISIPDSDTTLNGELHRINQFNSFTVSTLRSDYDRTSIDVQNPSDDDHYSKIHTASSSLYTFPPLFEIDVYDDTSSTKNLKWPKEEFNLYFKSKSQLPRVRPYSTSSTYSKLDANVREVHRHNPLQIFGTNSNERLMHAVVSSTSAVIKPTHFPYFVPARITPAHSPNSLVNIPKTPSNHKEIIVNKIYDHIKNNKNVNDWYSNTSTISSQHKFHFVYSPSPIQDTLYDAATTHVLFTNSSSVEKAPTVPTATFDTRASSRSNASYTSISPKLSTALNFRIPELSKDSRFYDYDYFEDFWSDIAAPPIIVEQTTTILPVVRTITEDDSVNESRTTSNTVRVKNVNDYLKITRTTKRLPPSTIETKLSSVKLSVTFGNPSKTSQSSGK